MVVGGCRIGVSALLKHKYDVGDNVTGSLITQRYHNVKLQLNGNLCDWYTMSCEHIISITGKCENM